MNDDMVMVEAYLKKTNSDEERKEIFKAFCDEPLALKPTIHAGDENSLEFITAGFKNKNCRQMVVGKLETKFPGKIDWR